ncbi:ninja-family protein AFP1-like [Actinidia eriantha]|uniref:ninja-family protein AFP1-like n=1 Tax=Actinidia eriantha TaxID=165200 RepID=UPI00258DB5AA|nr:ninja-family protein AFP1-like [Actinidia eriantha]
MAKDCPFFEVSSSGVEEEEEEIELSLGLSIGRNFRNSTKSNPEERKSPNFSSEKINSKYANVDADLGLESQRLQSRVRDRERRENEANAAGRIRKTDKNIVNEEIEVLSHNGARNPSPNPIRAGPMQYPYPQLQYVPLGNEFAYPCVMPYSASNSGSVANEKEEKNFQQSFRPYQGSPNPNPGQNLVVGSDSERDSGEEGGDRRAVSYGSPEGSSSGVSDHRSSFGQGGSSSDSGSHSSHYRPEQSLLIEASEQLTRSSSTKFSQQTRSEIQPEPIKNPISPRNPSPNPSKAASSVDLTLNHKTPSFSQIPCVSTTGNSPNGKTIHGFLYRYTPTEVCILCICHGTSFSPAAFVEHAGGKNISHPLRHITVVPSMF